MQHLKQLKKTAYPIWFIAFSFCLVFARLTGIFGNEAAFDRKWQKYGMQAIITVAAFMAVFIVLLPAVGTLIVAALVAFFLFAPKQ